MQRRSGSAQGWRSSRGSRASRSRRSSRRGTSSPGGGRGGHPPNPQTAPDDPAREAHKALGPADIIMPHITDAKHFEVPCVRGWGEWACSVHLPTWPVTIGGHTYDFGPTKHVLWMLIAATLVAVLLITV